MSITDDHIGLHVDRVYPPNNDRKLLATYTVAKVLDWGTFSTLVVFFMVGTLFTVTVSILTNVAVLGRWKRSTRISYLIRK
jgi:hypothetical protein